MCTKRALCLSITYVLSFTQSSVCACLCVCPAAVPLPPVVNDFVPGQTFCSALCVVPICWHTGSKLWNLFQMMVGAANIPPVSSHHPSIHLHFLINTCLSYVLSNVISEASAEGIDKTGGEACPWVRGVEAQGFPPEPELSDC